MVYYITIKSMSKLKNVLSTTVSKQLITNSTKIKLININKFTKINQFTNNNQNRIW